MAELLNRVNWVDILALILLIRITYVSSHIGVGKQILPFVLLVFILSLTLYNYRDIAFFFISRYSFTPSTCRFLSYTLMTIVLFGVYHLVSRVTGFILFPGSGETGGIEKTGGAILGFLRSCVIIGIILIGLLLTPVKFIESSVKNSYSGFLLINANLKLYVFVINLAFREDKASEDGELSKLIAKKEKYLFEPVDIKKKSRFYRETYN